MVEALDIEKLVGELEIAVDRLRSLYEQYFMGIEKLEPTVVRKDVDRRIHVLRKEQIRNTAQRFRFQMIIQRYNTYQTHWVRICREIDNGTYKRHLNKANQRFGRPASVAPPPPVEAPAPVLEIPVAPAIGVISPPSPPKGPPPLIRPQAGAAKPPPPPAAKPPPPAAAKPLLAEPALPGVGRKLSKELAAELAELDRDFAPAPPPPVPKAPAQPPPRPAIDMADERVKQLYVQYVDAKRKQNESTAGITYEAVAKSLRDSSSKLREKLGKPVDFEVTVKDGKTVLRPVIK